MMEMLDARAGERVLDVGAGQGVLAPYVARAGALYTGVDAGARLIKLARRRHGSEGCFLVGDARRLCALRELHEGEFDAVTFLLSIQDMDPLDEVLSSAAWALKPGGRAVLLLTHPAFRVPRQSGWGWDEGRKLHFRRVDSYLTPLAVPMKELPGQAGAATRSFHRPLGAYVNALASAGLLVEQMSEIPAHKVDALPSRLQAAHRARQEIPLFLGLRARKMVASG
jgi:SAM-dependent methyltransferase